MTRGRSRPLADQKARCGLAVRTEVPGSGGLVEEGSLQVWSGGWDSSEGTLGPSTLSVLYVASIAIQTRSTVSPSQGEPSYEKLSKYFALSADINICIWPLCVPVVPCAM